jgi:hypothetical protein
MRLVAWILLCWLTIGSAEANWYEATTPRVRVLAEGSENRARDLAEKIERFDAALRLLRGLPNVDHGAASRLTIYSVGSSRFIGRLAGSNNVAGFYSARAGGSVAFVPQRSDSGEFALRAEAVLLHEYAHHFMYRNFPGAYPTWLSEGFAEFHATARFERNGDIMFGHAPMYRAHGLVLGQQLPIERLLEPGDTRLTSAQVDNLYGRAWLLTHLLTFSTERRGQIERYIAAIRQGTGSVDAARAVFGDLKMLDRELDRYTRQRLTGLRIGSDRLKIPPIRVRRLSDAETAMMDIHIESTSGVTREEALRLLPMAQRAAAPYPRDPFAQGVLAEAEYDAGNYAAARDAALRALGSDPQFRQGLIYHGMALAALAREDTGGTTPDYRAIIAPWITANRADPDDPRPMLLIYQAAREFGSYDASIVKGVKYAQQIAPEDRGLRMIAAGEYLREGKLAEARPLIASLAYDRHARNREQMAMVLDMIDKGDSKAAADTLSRQGSAEVSNPQPDDAE